MSGEEFLSALIDIELRIEETREEETRVIVHNSIDAVSSRVINTGIDWEGDPFPPYSENAVPYYYFYTDPGEKKNTTRSNISKTMSKFIKTYGYDNLTYKNWRELHGLPTDKTTYSFTGDMWKSIVVDIIETGPDEIEWGVTSSDQQNLDVLLQHQKRDNILLLSDEEIDLINLANQDRIANIVTEELDKYD